MLLDSVRNRLESYLGQFKNIVVAGTKKWLEAEKLPPF